jgi:phosphoenolpyruvate-protein phosphotransferase (PTS system enzyme I)
VSVTHNIEKVFHATAASLGIAIGPALVIRELHKSYSEPEDKVISPEDSDREVERFNVALDQARDELEELRVRIQGVLEEREANVFDAHLMIVDDKMLMDEVEDMIRRHHHCAEYSFFKVVDRYVIAISVMPDPYIKERAADIKDVASRVLGIMLNRKGVALDKLTEKSIVIAHDLSPSATAMLDREKVLAFVVETGSNTSHTAILARSMQIPAIVGAKGVMQDVENGDLLIVDGFVGTVIVLPEGDTRKLYEAKATREEKFYVDLMRESKLRSETTDGFAVQLAANLESLDEVESAIKFGMYGVGLFRTEYMYMTPGTRPGEEELFNTFRKLIAEINGKPVVIRTLDIGGDKLADNLGVINEANPFLGLRAIRLCLKQERQLLREQIRAILRASAYGNLKIMFPMVSCSEEITELKSIMQECMGELDREGRNFNKNIEVGIMIETPAAVAVADVLAGMVDFFSIGTNDLVQYTSAIDRDNEAVAYLYRPEHPAILKMINQVMEAARNKGIWVSVCGEMAGDPRYTPLLVGLGVHELSMSSVSIGAIRRIIRKLSLHETEEVAKRAMGCHTSDDALNESLQLLDAISPDITELAFKGI